ncbi:MAG: class I SAM-dependent methyltransferase [Candidatus Doudnabacteria bacterium]
MKINLGCGYRKIEGFINIDNREECDPDILFDISKGLTFEDNSVDHVRSFDIIEHIPIGKVMSLIEEIYRVLKPNGIWESMTPSTDGRGAFQDPTHQSFHNINSHLYWTDDAYRDLYGTKAKFVGDIKDITSPGNVIHTYSVLKAVK